MKFFLFISFVLMGTILMISCDREMESIEEKVLFNVTDSENRSTAIDTAIQALVDSSKARLLNQPEYNWWMYHYEIENYGSSTILPPSSNPFLTTLPPDGSNDYVPLVMVCHRHDDGSLGCYGVWSVSNCEHELIEGIGCCNMDTDENDCEGEPCFCRKVDL